MLKHDAPASRCFYSLAETLDQEVGTGPDEHEFSGYWARIARLDQPAKVPEAPPLPFFEPPAAEEETGGTASRPTPRWSPEAEEPAAPPPWPVREATRDDAPPAEAPASGGHTPIEPTGDIAAAALALLGDESVPLEQADAFLRPLIEAYVKRFRRFPLDLRHSVYRILETMDFPAEDIRFLVHTLEDVYERRHKRPLRDIEDTFIQLLAEVHGSEQRMVELARQLRENARRQFGRDPFEPRRELVEQVRAGQYDEARLARLLDELRQAFETHHGRRFRDRNEELLAEIRNLTERMAHQEGELVNNVSRLFESINDTVVLRKELLEHLAGAEDDDASATPAEEGDGVPA
jgi:hypothetical protein